MGAPFPDADVAAVDSYTPEPVFIALSQPARLVLYRRLLAAGANGLSKRQLMADLHFTGGALTCHARVLQDAGLLEVLPASRKMGNQSQHRSGGYRCRARLAPLQSLVRGLANEATRAQASDLAVMRPREGKTLEPPGSPMTLRTLPLESHAS